MLFTGSQSPSVHIRVTVARGEKGSHVNSVQQQDNCGNTTIHDFCIPITYVISYCKKNIKRVHAADESVNQHMLYFIIDQH